MSSNREFVESLYAAFAEGNAEAFLGALHPEVEWNEAEGSPLDEGNPYIGPQGVAEGVMGRLMAEFDAWVTSPHTYVADGDRVVALGRYTAKHKETGLPLDAQFAHVWTVGDGQVKAFQQYTDTAQHRRVMDAD